MKTEYVALCTSCKDLILLVDLLLELCSAVGIDIAKVANMHITVPKDNVGALTLASLEPQHMTSCFKHYAITTGSKNMCTHVKFTC
ncbi:hypothetical protein ACHAW6_004844 [Cyclotella cf. meneghiniana]